MNALSNHLKGLCPQQGDEAVMMGSRRHALYAWGGWRNVHRFSDIYASDILNSCTMNSSQTWGTGLAHWIEQALRPMQS